MYNFRLINRCSLCGTTHCEEMNLFILQTAEKLYFFGPIYGVHCCCSSNSAFQNVRYFFKLRNRACRFNMENTMHRDLYIVQTNKHSTRMQLSKEITQWSLFTSFSPTYNQVELQILVSCGELWRVVFSVLSLDNLCRSYDVNQENWSQLCTTQPNSTLTLTYLGGGHYGPPLSFF